MFRSTIACGVLFAAGSGSAYTQSDKIVMKLGHVLSADGHYQLTALEFAKSVAAKTSGKIEVQVFPQSQLGGEVQMTQALRTGTQEMMISGQAAMVNTIKPWEVFDIPYLFDSIDDANRVMQGPVGKKFMEMMKPYNLVGLAWISVGERNLFTGKKTISSLNDVKTARRCLGVSQAVAGVRAEFEDGSVAEGNVLIGANGIHSTIRRILFGEDRPRFSGNVAYRGLAPAERLAHLDLQRSATNWMGPGAHFVHYFVSGGRYVNFVAVSEQASWERESWSDRGDIEDARGCYAGWHPQIHAILDAVDQTFKWALFDREPLKKWSLGRMTLLGDACHPMLPYMAQGAAQAIEDAATLAGCLAGVASMDVSLALERYENLRKPRTSWVQTASRGNAITFHLPDGPEQRERDGAMRIQKGLSSRREALFGFDAGKLG